MKKVYGFQLRNPQNQIIPEFGSLKYQLLMFLDLRLHEEALFQTPVSGKSMDEREGKELRLISEYATNTT